MAAEERPANAGPLSGLGVIELSHILAAPTCGLMLADLGADVIKVERPPKGDMTRWDTVDEDRMGEETASFMTVNRNKRSLALDLKSEGGKEVLGRLLRNADVLVENYRPGVLDRLGFGYDALKERCPRLVYCSISGYGRTGPWAERGGFDLVAQAMSGLMSITGEGPDRPPAKCGSPMTDIGAGILAAMGILAAVHERERTGAGQLVDTSLLEAGIAFTYWQSALVFASGLTPRAMGSAHPLYAPYRAFETADGWIALGTSNEANWRRLLDALDLPALGGLLLPAAIDTFWRWPLVVVWGTAAFGVYTLALVELGDRFTGSRLLAGTAAFTAMFGLGGIAGPALAGAAMERFGPDGLPWVLAGAYGALMLLATARRRRR